MTTNKKWLRNILHKLYAEKCFICINLLKFGNLAFLIIFKVNVAVFAKAI